MNEFNWIASGLESRLEQEIVQGLALYSEAANALTSSTPSLAEIKSAVEVVDYTRLESSDNGAGVAHFLSQINPQFMPAGVCVFSRWVSLVAQWRTAHQFNFRVATVAGSFPHGQNTLAQKSAEVQSIATEVDEIDYVIDRAALLDFDQALASEGELCQAGLAELSHEIATIRRASGTQFLKVILETSDISSPLALYHATRICAAQGANMVKTSTGKTSEGAVPHKVIPMLVALKDHHIAHSLKNWQVGLKLSGKVADAKQVAGFKKLFCVYSQIPEPQSQIFRIGASQLYGKLVAMGLGA